MSGHDLGFVGDVHLDRDDGHLEAFLAFLDQLATSCARVVFMGDLFNLWLGERRLEAPHQTAVVERCAVLRRRGVVLRYIEGNRDYRIAAAYGGLAFDDVAEHALTERCGPLRIWAAHGDRVNPADRQYRAWRRISRSRPVWGLFGLLPSGSRSRLAASIETRMRGTNLAFKREFPEAMVRAYAAPPLAAGHDLVVLGHFHVERELRPVPPAGPGRIFVLPEWRESRRWLRVRPDGRAAFETARD